MKGDFGTMMQKKLPIVRGPEVFELKVMEKLKEGWSITQIARFFKCSDIRIDRVEARLRKRGLIE